MITAIFVCTLALAQTSHDAREILRRAQEHLLARQNVSAKLHGLERIVTISNEYNGNEIWGIPFAQPSTMGGGTVRRFFVTMA
ncbi:MAG TPA: hypothetical protein VLM89_08300, partial [Phycisphaerae bacterium]|nr:hypothetical protein [Phycisphaerae bacterium]